MKQSTVKPFVDCSMGIAVLQICQQDLDPTHIAVSENPIPPNLASRTYLKCVKNSLINDRNLLDFPDSFSILMRGFKFSDRPIAFKKGEQYAHMPSWNVRAIIPTISVV